MARVLAMYKRITTLRRPTVTCALLLATAVAVNAHAGLPDPTRPLTTAPSTGNSGTTAANETLILHSVLIAGERRLAIINGRRVQVGDTVGRSRVVRIEAGEVHLRRDGELQTLTVYKRPAGFVRGKP